MGVTARPAVAAQQVNITDNDGEVVVVASVGAAMGRRGTIIRSVRFGVASDQWAPAGLGDGTGQGPPQDRRRGDEQRTNFLRRGLVGDQANDFTRSAAEAFDRSCAPAHRDAATPPAAGNGS